MSTVRISVRLRRSFCDEAATAFADVVSRRATTTTEIETAIAVLRTYFSTGAYSAG
jgi:hypothetical protein